MNFWSFLDGLMDNLVTVVLTIFLMLFAFLVLLGGVLLLWKLNEYLQGTLSFSSHKKQTL